MMMCRFSLLIQMTVSRVVIYAQMAWLMLFIITDSPPTSSTSNFLDVANSTPPRSRAISSPTIPRIQTSFPTRPRSRSPSLSPRIPSLPSFSLVGAVEFRDVIADLKKEASATKLSMFETPVTPFAGGHYHSHSTSRSRSRAQSMIGSAPKSSRSGDEENLRLSRSLHLDPGRPPLSPLLSNGSNPAENGGDYFSGHHHTSSGDAATPAGIPLPSIYRTPASPHEGQEPLYVPPTKRQRVWCALGEVAHTLFPTMHRIKEHSFLGKVAAVFAAPAVMALTLTLPVAVTPYDSKKHSSHVHGLDSMGVEEEILIDLEDAERENEERVLDAEHEVEETMHKLAFSKWLMAVQCLCGPMFCAGVLFSEL